MLSGDIKQDLPLYSLELINSCTIDLTNNATMNNHQFSERGHSVLGFITSYIANETSFQPATYIPTDGVNLQHNSFRFGKTNNFEALISGLQGSNQMATDYIVGVTASSMLIFGIALLWFLVIMGFKCAGQKRVGFLAGRLESPSWQPSLPPIEECLTEDDEVLSTQTPIGHEHGPEDFSVLGGLDQEQVQKFKRKTISVRVVFVISGLCVMVAGALFYAKGVTAFQNSLGDAQHSLLLVESTAKETVNLTR